jgi:tetratricopeptide (TPR) repeat protein
MERLRILAAAAALRVFTVAELCAFAGANADTVRSVLRRDAELFEPVPAASDGNPGRPAKRWKIKGLDRVREEIRELEKVFQPASVEGRIERDPDEDVFVAIGSAEDAILDSWGADAQDRVVPAQTAIAALRAARRMMRDSAIAPSDLLHRRADDIEVFAKLACADASGDTIGTEDLHRAAVALSDLAEVAPERIPQFLLGLGSIAVRNGQLLPVALVVSQQHEPVDVVSALDAQSWVEVQPLAGAGYRVWFQRWAAPLAEHHVIAGAIVEDATDECLDAALSEAAIWPGPTVVVSKSYSEDRVRRVSEAGAFFLPSPATSSAIASTIINAVRRTRLTPGAGSEEVSPHVGTFGALDGVRVAAEPEDLESEEAREPALEAQSIQNIDHSEGERSAVASSLPAFSFELPEPSMASGALTAYRRAQVLGQATPTAGNSGRGWPQLDSALACAAYGLAIKSGDEEEASRAEISLAALLAEHGRLEEARRAYEQSIESEHSDMARIAAFNLGLLLVEEGDEPGALAAFERSVDPEQPDSLWRVEHLAITRSELGEFDFARRISETVLDACRRVLGEDHPDTITATNDLAAVLWAKGDFRHARTLFGRVRDVRQRTLGAQHPWTLTATNNFAVTLRSLGDFAAARRLHEQVLEARRRELGDENPETLVAINNLAETIREQGQFAAARELHERVLEARRRLLGDEDRDTLKSVNNLAVALRATGEFIRARSLHEQALDTRRRVFGDNHPDTLTSVNSLAVTLRALGELAAAHEFLDRVIDIRQDVLGAEHPDTLKSINNLAETLRDEGNLAAARRHHEHVLTVRRRVLGEGHPSTLTSKNGLAVTLRALEDVTGAYELSRDVVAARESLLGEEHPDTLASSFELAVTMRALGEFSSARERFEHVLDARRRVLGEEHPDTLTSSFELAVTMRALGEFSSARERFEQVLKARRSVLGTEHPDTLASISELAASLWEQSEVAAAREVLEEALDAHRRAVGKQHPDAAWSPPDLAVTLRTGGESADARQIQELTAEAA